jgi:hypothetical protein
MPIEPAEVKIEIGAYGLKALEVNGENWTERATELQVNVGRDSIPSINVGVIPKPFVYEGPGIVVIEIPIGDPHKAMDDFLAGINADALEGLALQNTSFGESGTQAILNALREMLNVEH